jgi:2-phospho-L-lactate guanylyltransferase
MPWTVIVPMRSLDEAKSRLRGATESPTQHRELVRAIRADCVHAVMDAALVARVVIVAERPDEIDLAAVLTIDDGGQPGLNAAVRHAGEVAAQRWPPDGIAVMVGDLAALTATVVQDVLGAADEFPDRRAMVIDRQGTGTTMLLSGPGLPLTPYFGPDSAVRHQAAGYQRLDVDPRARLDVDEPGDLKAAIALGIGPAVTAFAVHVSRA